MATVAGFLGNRISMMWTPSARGRSIRLSIFIVVIISLALASLAWRNINIDFPGGSDLKRGGGGPLGLKLGLDLSGGAHLVFQADTGTRFDLTFAEPITTAEVAQALQEARFGDDALAIEEFSVVARSPVSVQVRTGVLDEDDPRSLDFQDTLSSVLGTITDVRIDVIGEPTPEQMEGAVAIIKRRVNLFGTEEPIIQRFGDDRIIVQLPGASGSVTELQFVEPVPEAADVEMLLTTLAAAGYEALDVDRRDDRSFRIRSATVGAEISQRALASIVESLGAVARFDVTSGIDDAKALIGETARLEFKERTCFDANCFQFTDDPIGSGLSGDDLSNAFASIDPLGVGWVINLEFNSRGADLFSKLTERIFTQQNIKRIAFFLDGQTIKDAEGRDLAPVARAHIRDGRTVISGNFTREEARTFSIQLESGRLPVPLKLIQENDVDALLGSESLRNSLIAGVVGLGLVMVFMIAYYRMAGVVASLALLFYAVVVLAIFKLIPITLTLSHIGGFILSVGMAVDANVLIFERMKEELRIGRTLASSMEVGFNRAWPAIRDGNVSTLITCLVLLWFGDRLGGGLVTGFAISLGIGVLASMFTAVIVSRNLLQLMAWIGLGHRIGLFTPEGAQRAAPVPDGGG